MKGRKKKGPAAPPPEAAATPFFARFLEDQHGGDAEAKVSARRSRAQAAAKSSGGAKSSGTLQTLKYPSDRDEWVFYPYHLEAATAKAGPTRQTLKYPSDRDEDIEPYFALYADAADAPKTASAKPKKGSKISLTSKADDIDQVAS